MEKITEEVKNFLSAIRNYIHAIFYSSFILFLGSLFYKKTYAFSNEKIAYFALLWMAVSLASFFFNDMLSLLQPHSLIALQKQQKFFVNETWWAFVVIGIHVLIFGIGIFFSFRIM